MKQPWTCLALVTAQKTHEREEPALCREPRRAAWGLSWFLHLCCLTSCREGASPVGSGARHLLRRATAPWQPLRGPRFSSPLVGRHGGCQKPMDRPWLGGRWADGRVFQDTQVCGRPGCCLDLRGRGMVVSRLYLPCVFQGSWLLSANGNSCLGAGVALAGTPWSPLV